MKASKIMMSLLALMVVVACSKMPWRGTAAKDDWRRGDRWEYDPGAPKDSKWPDLFAQTPNYRAFGKAIIGGYGEKFRWKMGPMWYRGRLQPNKVKVFIIGQEGAQDENVSNRSFTGSTGTRMQKFINYFGINESYLYMNTFVYTITGQYSLFGEDREDPYKLAQLDKLLWLAQNDDSIVVEHRHKLFDYMLENNKDTLALVIGVGTAGKDSAAKWARHHGANCESWHLGKGYCEGKGKLKGVKIFGVSHPGAASERNGGSDAVSRLKNEFSNKAAKIASFIKNNPKWLEKDPTGYINFDKPFKYGYASIPHRDFAYGTNWRMGQLGTTSNRRGAHTIQVFSDEGCYNNTCTDWNTGTQTVVPVKYDNPPELLTRAPKEMQPGDVPYESPKNNNAVNGRRDYDEGPGEFAQVLTKFFMRPDYPSLGAISHESFGHNGIYRGRLDRAAVLVVADQHSHDGFHSTRALTGEAGQRFQNVLYALGAKKEYGIVSTLPVDTLGLEGEKLENIVFNDEVVKRRNDVLDAVLAKGQTKVILTIGPMAKKVVEKYYEGALNKLPVVNFSYFNGKGNNDWNEKLQEVKKLGLTLEWAGSFKYNDELAIIPRSDLPAYTRWWMGTSGDRVARAYTYENGQKVPNGNYYKIYAPKWASKWRVSVSDLTPEEQESVAKFKASGVGGQK